MDKLKSSLQTLWLAQKWCLAIKSLSSPNFYYRQKIWPVYSGQESTT